MAPFREKGREQGPVLGETAMNLNLCRGFVKGGLRKKDVEAGALNSQLIMSLQRRLCAIDGYASSVALPGKVPVPSAVL
jgi:hypothetical protein